VSQPDACEARRRGAFEQGYSLVALVASVTIMMILMAAAVPSWKYVMKNDREEELLFRGGEIADAIVRFQKKNANAYPTSLDQLVKGRFLRKLYKEPMSKDGKWRLVHQGQTVTPGAVPGQDPTDKGMPITTTTTTTTTTMPSGTAATGSGGTTVGAILGVSSTSTEKSLRIFNGRTQYNEWIFAAGQPRVIGRPPTVGGGGTGDGSTGGKSPSPSPMPTPPAPQ
jgi:type II secretory pathway pseudopilin PulG